MRFLKHEYGHYLQEQAWGPLTLISCIESSLDFIFWPKADHNLLWVEKDANIRARTYFVKKKNSNFNPETWDDENSNYYNFNNYNQSEWGGKYYEERITNILLLSTFLLIP